ncbi:MAG: hypothetical protein ACTSRG_02425 [Candidatus Helarchaeota archaeon]
MDNNEVILVKSNDTQKILNRVFNYLNEPDLFRNKNVVLKPNPACWDSGIVIYSMPTSTKELELKKYL